MRIVGPLIPSDCMVPLDLDIVSSVNPPPMTDITKGKAKNGSGD